MQRMVKYVFWLMILFLLAGCTREKAENGRSDSDANGESEPIIKDDELSYEGDPPSAGKGNVFGEIRWNGRGDAGRDVFLCADFSAFSGCGSEEFKETTDVNGRYLFTDVEPGIYALSVRVSDNDDVDSDDRLYISNGILSSAEFEVEAGKTLIIDIQDIFKLDLIATNPDNGSKEPDEVVTLEWEDYDDASYYKVSLYPEEGDAILLNRRVDELSIEVNLLLVNCGYRWRVEAFSDGRIKIAEMAKQFEFVVDKLEGSCVLTIEEPTDGAEIRGDNIVLNWEDSPLALTYKILMWNDDDPDRENVLDFEVVNESSYRFEEALTPARYVWSVDAYDEDGDKIGGTKIFDFTVRP